MPSNSIDFNSITRDLQLINSELSRVESFISGQEIDTIRIKDASIGTAKIGNLQVTNAKFQDLAITNAKIVSVSAEKLTTGFLSADRIFAGSITANKLNVSALSAISSNFGNVTSGTILSATITGGTIRNSSSDTRVEMNGSSNSMIFRNSSGEKVIFNANGIRINDLPLEFVFDGQFKARIQQNSGDSLVIESRSVSEMYLANTLAGANVDFVSANGSVQIGFASNNVFVNGNPKSAIVETSLGYRALYCAESPEVWFFDIVDDLKKTDPIFEEITSGDTKALRTDQGKYLIFKRRKGFDHTRFEKKTAQQFYKNNSFWGNV